MKKHIHALVEKALAAQNASGLARLALGAFLYDFAEQVADAVMADRPDDTAQKALEMTDILRGVLLQIADDIMRGDLQHAEDLARRTANTITRSEPAAEGAP